MNEGRFDGRWKGYRPPVGAPVDDPDHPLWASADSHYDYEFDQNNTPNDQSPPRGWIRVGTSCTYREMFGAGVLNSGPTSATTTNYTHIVQPFPTGVGWTAYLKYTNTH